MGVGVLNPCSPVDVSRPGVDGVGCVSAAGDCKSDFFLMWGKSDNTNMFSAALSVHINLYQMSKTLTSASQKLRQHLSQ